MPLPEPKIHFCVDDVSQANEEKVSHLYDVISDTISDFFYYNRKECEDFPVGKIEDMVAGGVLTVDDIVGKFRECIEEALLAAGRMGEELER